MGPKKNILKFIAIYNEGQLNVSIFNRYFLKNQLKVGQKVTLKGKYNLKYNSFAVADIYIEPIVEPTYVLKYKLTKNKIAIKDDTFRSYVKQILSDESNVENFISREISTKYKLVTRFKALTSIHFPTSDEDVFQAIRYLKFEELYLYFLQIEMMLRNKEKRIGIGGSIDDIATDIKNIGFDLTSKQIKALEEGIEDLNSDVPGSRLIQGDVGSGKTIVVEMLLKYVCNFGRKGVLIAPTTIVSHQHFLEISERFSDLKVLEVNSKTLNASLAKTINDGDFDILVGTSSIMSKKLVLENLGIDIVIVDEQHRFGVKQRLSLEQRLPRVSSFFLSATPIPRTLSLSLLGYIKTSIIDEYPASRKEVFSKIIESEENSFGLIKDELNKHNKIYVVVSKIENSDDEYKSIVGTQKKYQRYFKDANVQILHSKLSTEEKDEIFEKFANGWIDILIATTIVEVGVNNKDATVIVIKDAKNFGVSQLHQLRGRVGRSNKQSYAFFEHDDENDDAYKRLEAVASTSDGFKLAEFDLENRGAGSIVNVSQSGSGDFKLVSLLNKKDQVIAKYAKMEAINTLNSVDLSEEEKLSISMCKNDEITHLN